jgi:hypothetical protein
MYQPPPAKAKANDEGKGKRLSAAPKVLVGLFLWGVFSASLVSHSTFTTF